MAELYVARCKAMVDFRRLVALKRILPHHASADEFVGMFLDEARLAAKIQHPNVAQVYDIGVDVDGLFYTMELIRGEDLRTLLKTTELFGERLPLDLAIAIVVAAAAGLHAAHEQRDEEGRPLGIVHRDVSPSNVLVSFDGDVKLIDFGVAKARGRKTKTRDGTIKGKVAYMAPEQCRGEDIDRRSDVFAMGILLYELTTTTRLFFGENDFATLRQIVHDDIPLPSTRVSGYPAELEAIVMRALERDLDARYQSADELRRDLIRFAQASKMSLEPARLAAYMRARFPSSFQAWEALRKWEDESGVFPPAHAGETLRPEIADTMLATSAPVQAALDLLRERKSSIADDLESEQASDDDDGIPLVVDSRPIRLTRRRRVQPAPVMTAVAFAVAVWALWTRGGESSVPPGQMDPHGQAFAAAGLTGAEDLPAPAPKAVAFSIANATNVAEAELLRHVAADRRAEAAYPSMLISGPIARSLMAIQSWASPVYAPMRAVLETAMQTQTLSLALPANSEAASEREPSSAEPSRTQVSEAGPGGRDKGSEHRAKRQVRKKNRGGSWDPDSALPPM